MKDSIASIICSKAGFFYWMLSTALLISCSDNSTKVYKSPSGSLSIEFSDFDKLAFFVRYEDDTVFANSSIGLSMPDIDKAQGIKVELVESSSYDQTWTTTNGKQPEVRNRYNAYSFEVKEPDGSKLHHQITFRLYDDGFAYRYVFPDEAIRDSVLIDSEISELRFSDNSTLWAFNGENHNVGPLQRSEVNSDYLATPAVLQLNEDLFMAIHEAGIFNFAPLSLNLSNKDGSISINTEYKSQTSAFQTSWRAFMIGDEVGDLVSSDLLVNLNEPSKIQDVSWIKPGKSLWDWRVWGYQAEDGFEYGLNTKSHIRMIDFAAENNIQYLLIDADWYGEEFNETSDPTSAREGIDIESCMAYANSKNVGIILYLNDIGAKKFGLDRVLKQFSEWGAVGVKYGFMTGTPQNKVIQTRKVIETCAKYRLMVDFHDNPIPPSGDRRTWPNVVTREYGHAQADAKKSYFPETAVNTALINMIAGPIDMTNGWFDLNNAHSRVRVFEEIPGTVAAEVAKLIVVYSGLMVLPDSPEEYLKKNDLFDCIRKMPAQFDSFRVLDAELDGFISVARQSGDDWFVGTLTNREARSMTVDLNFLPKGKQYSATLYEDADETHFLTNKETYRIRKMEVDSKDQLEVRLAHGGGNAIHFTPIN